jgi:hypothetical protein
VDVSRKISQREAAQWRKRALAAEEILHIQKRHYWKDWPSSTVIARSQPAETVLAAVKTARMLEHGVVAVTQDKEMVYFAVKL